MMQIAFEERYVMIQQVDRQLQVEFEADWSPLSALKVDGDHPPRVRPPQRAAFDQDAAENWDGLLDAVKLRLQRCVGEGTTSGSDGTIRVTATVLDCVKVLSQLQAGLARERSHHHQLAQDFVETQSDLAEARAELVGTQAGERRARHQALHDSLTSLPNRLYFRERLSHALAHLLPDALALAVLYLDLDGFKSVNDLHGHDAGDELLRITATRLNRVVRNEDMASRIGGDEFACLRAGAASHLQLKQLADKLFDAVSAPMQIAGTLTLSIRPSIGIAIYPMDGRTATDLLKSADAAMYHAKRLQSRRAFFGEIPKNA